MADNFAELPFGNQQARPNPALDVAANRLHDGEGGLDHIRATESGEAVTQNQAGFSTFTLSQKPGRVIRSLVKLENRIND